MSTPHNDHNISRKSSISLIGKPDATRTNLGDSNEHAELADFVLSQMGRPPPSISFIKAMVDKPSKQSSSLELITDALKTQREQHTQDIMKLCEFQVHRRERLYMEHQLAMNYGDYYPNDELDPRNRMEERMVNSSILQQTSTFDASLSEFRSAFAQTQLPLQRLRGKFQNEQKEDEHRRNREFPGSIEAFDSISSRDHQLRVATFLQSKDISEMVVIQTKNGWNVDKIASLKKIYEENIEFQHKIRDFVASTQSVDPRRRPTN